MLAFGFGNPVEWLIIAGFALVIFGPKRMPDIGRQLGQAMREFRKITDEFTGMTHSVRDEVESVYKPVLTPPTPIQTTSSATVETAVSPRTYDQEPEHLMAPVVHVPPQSSAGEAETKGK